MVLPREANDVRHASDLRDFFEGNGYSRFVEGHDDLEGLQGVPALGVFHGGIDGGIGCDLLP